MCPFCFFDLEASPSSWHKKSWREKCIQQRCNLARTERTDRKRMWYCTNKEKENENACCESRMRLFKNEGELFASPHFQFQAIH